MVASYTYVYTFFAYKKSKVTLCNCTVVQSSIQILRFVLFINNF